MKGPRVMTAPTLARLALLASAAFGSPALAQLAPPMLRSSTPIGAAAGDSLTLEARGTDFADGASLRFDDPGVKVEGVELGKADGGGQRTLKARVTIPAGSGPGPLRFRVVADGGVSNPRDLRVGRPIPTVAEVEPNDGLRKPQAVGSPSAIEGVIAKGDDVDVYAVEVKAGETLVAEAIASRAGSRLDAYLTIYSTEGRELAADDDRFGRDAAAWATVATSGRYFVAIQDANGKHRDGGIEQKTTRPYRLEIGKLTLVDRAFPPGGRRGQATEIRLAGANLPEGELARFEPPGDAPTGDRLATFLGPFGPSNALTLRVGDSEEYREVEAGGKPTDAPTFVVPGAINGTFARPDGEGEDHDAFRLKAVPGREGEFAITVLAARIGSPADPVLAVLDARGEPSGEYDDDQLGRDVRVVRRVDSGEGLLVSVRDYYGRGGERFAYRVEVEPVARGVSAVVDLGHRAVPRSGTLVAPVTFERSAFDGPVTFRVEGLPEGVTAGPLALGPGESAGFLAFEAAEGAAKGAFAPRVVGEGVPASLRFRERGALDEVPREGDPAKGPRETTVESAKGVVAVAERATLGLASPGSAKVARDGRVELTWTVERRPGAAGKRVKVRLVAPGKALEGFEPVKELDLAPEAVAATFALKPKAGAKPGPVALATRAWVEGSSEAVGLDARPVVLTVE